MIMVLFLMVVHGAISMTDSSTITNVYKPNKKRNSKNQMYAVREIWKVNFFRLLYYVINLKNIFINTQRFWWWPENSVLRGCVFIALQHWSSNIIWTISVIDVVEKQYFEPYTYITQLQSIWKKQKIKTSYHVEIHLETE